MGLINYVKATRAELTHVNWPTRRQTIWLTIVVVVLAVGLSLLLGAFDLIFSWLLQFVI